MRRFATTREVWIECGDYGTHKSIFEMLEEETGVDLQLTGCEDWHTLSYFSEDAWDGKMLTIPQAIYMRQQQRKWIAPMLLACICISLYRDEHWGAERLAAFIGKINQLRQQLGEDPENYAELMFQITGKRREELLPD